ncbi:PREDICTED: uncharacterized protein LOC109342008 [Lupinus angustifolius]|uniref:uncharacterized protein LOC109342008 n=1 Tax=Lupinus angustifolius TaxID=3871 RepID=UPI00092E65FB|nr:PREDICTED: uncharacterized protein LOC109342008 [Lupinus angustifolius]
MEIFKTLQINIPFAEALEQMPIYSKFMKELLTKKRSYQEEELLSLNATCSAILQTNIPHKSKDPGSVTIQVTIGNVSVGKALVNLGASVSLRPLSMMKRIGGIQLKPTRMSLQLADRSIKYPERVVEDVLVKVGKFLIHVDFVVIDITEDKEIPLILGRPFMRTAKMGIDMENDVIEEICAEQPQPDNSSEMEQKKVEEEIIRHFYDELLLHQNPNGPAEKESELELKELPPHLKYVPLNGNTNNPVIINSELSKSEEEKLIQVLKKHQAALGWNLKDLKGIIPSNCMHKIMMEDDYNHMLSHKEDLIQP